jgi:hypothetical protein
MGGLLLLLRTLLLAAFLTHFTKTANMNSLTSLSSISLQNPLTSKGITQRSGNFDNNRVWTYGLLLKRIRDVAEEYGIKVIYVDEKGTSSRCPLHGDGCGIRVYRGLFKCMKLGKVFNADIAAARNILMTAMSNNTSMTPVTPEPRRGVGGNGRRPGQGLNLQKEGCSPNLPTPNGEEVGNYILIVVVRKM